MTDSADDRPFSHVKHLREIRDRIGKELEHMTADEIFNSGVCPKSTRTRHCAD